MVNKTRKEQIWQTRVKECQNSPISAKQWCQENQIAYSTYSYWVKKCKTVSTAETAVFLDEPVFVSLTGKTDLMKASKVMPAPVSMFLGTVRIEVSSACPQHLLQSLVEVLKQYA